MMCAKVCDCLPYVFNVFLLFIEPGDPSKVLLPGNSHTSLLRVSVDVLGVVICVMSAIWCIDCVRLAFCLEAVGSLIEVKEEVLVVLLRFSFLLFVPEDEVRGT